MLKESKNPYGYKNLLVYKKAEDMQAACAAVTAIFPSYTNPKGTKGNIKTLSALADQMDRSARSVKQNIVEGWKRNSTKEYYEFLGFSLGANAELEEDCNDIIKGIYKGLEWDEKGGKGNEGEKEKVGQGNEGDKKEERGGTLLPAALGAAGPLGSHYSPLPPSAPLTLGEVERLPFYPIAPHLPPVVTLKLQCKELNFLIHKLQESLAAKMTEEQTLSQNDLLKRAHNRRKGDEAWLALYIEEQGMVRKKDGRVVPKGKKGEQKG